MPLKFPDIEVNPAWAAIHRWGAGQRDFRRDVPVSTLWLVEAGEISAIYDDRHFSVRAGQALLMPPCQGREVETRCGASWHSLGLSARLFGQIDALQPLTPSLWQPAASEMACLIGWVGLLEREWEQPDVPSSLLARGLATAVLGLCARSLQRPDFWVEAQHKLPAWLNQTLRGIHDSPRISPSELAHNAGFSPAQFRRNFHAAVGMAPRDYLLRHRLKLAHQWLANSDLPIAQIAQQCGIGEPAHFSRLFRREFGMTPTQTRKLRQSTQV
jgi:AraC-like DNA-binding protein